MSPATHYATTTTHWRGYLHHQYFYYTCPITVSNMCVITRLRQPPPSTPVSLSATSTTCRRGYCIIIITMTMTSTLGLLCIITSYTMIIKTAAPAAIDACLTFYREHDVQARLRIPVFSSPSLLLYASYYG